MEKIIMERYSAILRRWWGRFHIGINGVMCCLCGRHSRHFLPFRGGWRNAPPLMSLLNVVGSDLDNVFCPNCGSTDRERHMFLYLDRLGLWPRFTDACILHFAPERILSNVIASKKPAKWVRADLFPSRPEIERIDMLSIPYANETFDIVIANHVLEHVNDDGVALRELHRVLKPDGIAILQTPFSEKLNCTISDPGVDTDAARYQLFGLKTHVRLYGKDIFSRIESAGFLSKVVQHADTLADIDTVYYGIYGKEPLFLFEKQSLQNR